MSTERQTCKICLRVSPETYERLSEIASKRNCSVYRLVQLVIQCFMQEIPTANDTFKTTIKDEIDQMFRELNEAEKHVEYEMPKRAASCKSLYNDAWKARKNTQNEPKSVQK